MIQVEKSTVINQPPEAVWRYVGRPEKWSVWRANMVAPAEKLDDKPFGKGARYRYKSHAAGRDVEAVLEVDDYEEGRFLAASTTSGSFPATMRFTCDPNGAGTRVTHEVKAEVGGFIRLAEPLVRRILARQTAADLETLKDLVEAGE